MSFSDSFPGFRLRLTRWGGVFLVALLVLGFAAVNTGNNALMALLGLGLGSYVVAGAWSRQVLAMVEVRAKLPSELYAGRSTPIEVELVNRSRIFPGYGLLVRDAAGRELVCEPLLPPGSCRRYAVQVEIAERGWRALGPWRLEVLLPLGFFLKSKEQQRERRVLVYPRLLSASSASDRRGVTAGRLEDLTGRGREGEVVQLRDFRDGDDRRQLHWKQTARQQRPIVVDRQRRSQRSVVLIVDPRLTNPEDAGLRERFERMISDVATGVVRRLERGEAVGVVVGSTVVLPVRSRAQAGRLLRPLAEVEPQPAAAPPPRRVGSAAEMTYRVEGP
jgi:uncharacterized protein (DUF58 family)